MAVTVDKNKCPQSHRCPSIRVCPVDAISQKGYSLPQIDEDKCIECGKCVKYCPTGAITMK